MHSKFTFTHMPIECPVCQYWGATCYAMRKHIAKVHLTTETEGSDIDSSGELTRHYVQSQQSPIKIETKCRIGNGAGNVLCFICNQEFPDRDALKTHMQSSHMKWFLHHL